MSWEQILKAIASEAVVIAAAPISFTVALLVASGAVYLIARWMYSTIISHKNAEISSLQTMVKLRDDQLSNKFQTTSPDEARKMIEALQVQVAQLTPRRLPTGEQRTALINRIRTPAGEERGVGIKWEGLAPDAELLANDLASLLDDAGWAVIGNRYIGGSMEPGIVLTVTGKQKFLVAERLAKEVFEAAKLSFEIKEDKALPLPEVRIGRRQE